MDILNEKTDLALLQSMVGEIAKATNELKCSIADTQKAQSRLSFVLLLTHKLIEREINGQGKEQI